MPGKGFYHIVATVGKVAWTDPYDHAFGVVQAIAGSHKAN